MIKTTIQHTKKANELLLNENALLRNGRDKHFYSSDIFSKARTTDERLQ